MQLYPFQSQIVVILHFQTNLNIHCRHVLIKYAPALLEVVYRPFQVVVGIGLCGRGAVCCTLAE